MEGMVLMSFGKGLTECLLTMLGMQLFILLFIIRLESTTSDHSLMHITCVRSTGSFANPFQFIIACNDYEGFLDLVEKVWNKKIQGNTMFV